jgi:hypothetical protein
MTVPRMTTTVLVFLFMRSLVLGRHVLEPVVPDGNADEWGQPP